MHYIIGNQMIKIEQTDANKETVTYLKAYNLASKLIKKSLDDKSLHQLQNEIKEQGFRVPLTILSQIKNKSLKHQYPNTIRLILLFFGYKNVFITKKILLTFDKPDKKT